MNKIFKKMDLHVFYDEDIILNPAEWNDLLLAGYNVNFEIITDKEVLSDGVFGTYKGKFIRIKMNASASRSLFPNKK